MSHLLFKQTIDFSGTRFRDIPVLLNAKNLIVGIDDGNNAEVIDSAYLIQYPFLDAFGFVKGEYFRLTPGYNLLQFSIQLYSKFRLLPLRKQAQITVTIWDYTMPLYPDQPNPSSTSATTTPVNASITQVTLAAANSSRKGAAIYNNSALATLYIGFGDTVTTTAFAEKIGPSTTWEMPNDYDGKIVGIWSVANGNALVTEFV